MKNLCLLALLITLAMAQGSLRAEDRVPDVSEDPFFAAAVENAIEDLSGSSSAEEDELLSEVGEDLSLGADATTDNSIENDTNGSKKNQGGNINNNSTEAKKEKLRNYRKRIVDEAIKKTLAIVRAKASSLVAKAIKPVTDRLNVLEEKKTPPCNPNTDSRSDSNADLVDKVTTAVLQRLTDVVNKQINAALANYVLPDSARNSIAQQAQAATLNQISTQGLSIGRWVINQESGSYLVFRDAITSKTRDSRYAMTAGVYRNP